MSAPTVATSYIRASLFFPFWITPSPPSPPFRLAAKDSYSDMPGSGVPRGFTGETITAGIMYDSRCLSPPSRRSFPLPLPLTLSCCCRSVRAAQYSDAQGQISGQRPLHRMGTTGTRISLLVEVRWWNRHRDHDGGSYEAQGRRWSGHCVLDVLSVQRLRISLRSWTSIPSQISVEDSKQRLSRPVRLIVVFLRRSVFELPRHHPEEF